MASNGLWLKMVSSRSCGPLPVTSTSAGYFPFSQGCVTVAANLAFLPLIVTLSMAYAVLAIAVAGVSTRVSVRLSYSPSVPITPRSVSPVCVP